LYLVYTIKYKNMIRKKTTKKEKKTEAYTAKDIYVMKGLEAVRRRPGMYIGSTGTEGLHHLIFECVDNAIDEAVMGYCNKIEVEILPENRIRVSDNGRGIPVEKHAQTKKSALETVMTMLHAGAKFGGKTYRVTGGLHGVGISIVCALSSYFRAEVCRGGFKYFQEYSKGEPKTKVKKIDKSIQTGTSIIFEPDKEIFKLINFNLKKILSHLRQQAYLTRGIKIVVSDKRTEDIKNYTFCFEGGIGSYIKYLTRDVTCRHPNIFYCLGNKNGIIIEAAIRYTEEYECYEESFANNIYTQEGGTHLTGFRTALTRTFNDYARRSGLLKESDKNLTGEDVREGLTSVVSLKIPDPQFEGQTKTKLGNPEAKLATEFVISQALIDFLERNPQDAKAILENCIIAAKAREAAKTARETVLRKGVLGGLSLPGKLADCVSKKPEESELYIVEGESAGGCFFGNTKVTLIDGRNLTFKELIKEDKKRKRNYCFTIKEDGKIGIGLIRNPRKTRRNAEVLKIILDNDEEIICTPDHLFMLRNGCYKKAEDLTSKDSLMPLCRKYSKIKEGDKSILRFDTICRRFFKNNEEKLKEVVLNYNHKIKKITKLKKRMDVYDLEVKGTHNFALASNIFVHNSSRQARDRHFQAILPLKGKILNVERVRLDKILTSKEIRSLIIALGTAIAQDFNLDKLRYHRVILMTDADSDGSHIRTLLLTLFFRYFKPIIDKGCLYIAQPPLYRIQTGKKIDYAYTEEDKAEILSSLKKPAVRRQERAITPSIQRYKGLGEMNPEELWSTTMNPENRVLLQVTIESAMEADKILDVLMGKEVLPRKKFIQTHAKAVKNLDI